MDADAGRVRTALRLQAVAARVHHMDCAGFAEEVCDAVDVAGRLGYLGCLHAVVRLAAAREAMPDADGMTCGELGCLAGLRRQARATDTLDADSFTPASSLPWISRGGRIDLPTKSRRCAWPT